MAEFDVGMKIDPQIEDALDFPVENLLGEAIFRYAVAQHAPQFWHGLKNIDLMAESPEEIGTG